MTKLKPHPTWQTSLSNLITDPEELLHLLELDHAWLEPARAAARLFPLKVTRNYVSRMEKGNPQDPLLLQVLPLGLEHQIVSGYTKDPLKELDQNPVPGLLHKYHGRVLVTLTSACAIHCRYCFRRHFPYDKNNPGTREGWQKIFNYIQTHPTVQEVILSGGDPLVTNDKLLNLFSDGLHSIPHIQTLRIHSRLPIVLPERITAEFLSWIKQVRMKVVVVIHANHPNEIDSTVEQALYQLSQAHVMLLNQTVLLKGINDNAETLAKLNQILFQNNVLPYYLHTLDPVQGAAHFDLPVKQAKHIHTQLSHLLPGYLLPRLVREDAHLLAKTLL